MGVEVKDIINHMRLRDIKKHKGITRQSVNAHLNNLVAEGEIKKTRKGRYLTREIFDDIVYDGWSYFEDFLSTLHAFIINDRTVLNLRELANIIVDLSNEGSNKQEESLEKFIFKYANRLGAYLVYVFIESLRSRRNVRSEDVRSVLTEQFLYNAIPLMDLLEGFLNELPIDPKDRSYLEVKNESTFQRVSGAYKKVLPSMSKSIEDRYLEFSDILLTTHRVSKNGNCSHKWEKICVHKIGDRYLCRKCDTIVVSPEDISGSTSA